jgi:hypothetical protein
MFLLVTGASGAGKSTARLAAARELSAEIDSVELGDVVEIPARPTIAWRQRATETVVQRALERQADGRHLLLCGDPVAPGEVLAAPSATRLTGVAVCLLDLNPDAQTARLSRRGDDPALFVHHHAFADWMRGHARDPRHLPHVVTADAWEAMRWERWTGVDPNDGTWGVTVLDTTELSPEDVATEVVAWCRRALRGHTPVMKVGADGLETPPFR